jgi:hypothetical protein
MADEVSSWENVARVEQSRKRGSTRPFFKLIVFSSPDPEEARTSDNDPIFQELSESTAEEWMAPDPKTGAAFEFDTGQEGDGPGLKWAHESKRADGTWDLAEVERSAFYRTPAGAIIKPPERWPLIQAGGWRKTNDNHQPGKVGFHMGSFLLPWEDQGGFGHLARRKVQAVMRGPEAHRVYRYQVEAKKWKGAVDSMSDDLLAKCRGGYKRGTLFTDVPMYTEWYKGKARLLVLTADIQHIVFWWRLRLWIAGGDSAGVDYGMAHTWGELADIADEWGKKGIDMFVLVDSGDGQRSLEIGEACQRYNFIACKGSSTRIRGVQKLQYKAAWNYRQGTTGSTSDGNSCPLILHDPHSMKDDMFSRIQRRPGRPMWYIEDDVGPDYAMQMKAQERGLDGLWKQKPGYKDDHLLDTEELQMVCAAWQGFAANVWDDIVTETSGQERSADVAESNSIPV